MKTDKYFILGVLEEKVKRLKAIPKDDEGNALFVYEKAKDVINEKENYVYFLLGNPLFLPEEIEGKPVPIGSEFRSWFTQALWTYTNVGWVKVGNTDPEVVELNTPVDEMIVNTEIDFDLSTDGTFERKQVNDRVYSLPIYSAENSSTLYRHDALNANVQLALIGAVAGYNFKIIVDGEEIEDLSFDTDLTDRVEVILIQDEIAQGKTDLEYGAVIYIEADITDDPKPEISSGSMVSDEETPTISNFVISNNTITIDPQSAVGANWRVNGIAYTPDWDNIKLYLGEYNTETEDYDYRPYVPNETITQDNNKYRFMPVYNGQEPSEDNWNTYNIVFGE